MKDYVEYEFLLPDGSVRYEMLTRGNVPTELHLFKRMHKAKVARPVPAQEGEGRT